MEIEFAPRPRNSDSTPSSAGINGTKLDHGTIEPKQESGRSGVMQRARQKEGCLSTADLGRTSDETLSGSVAKNIA